MKLISWVASASLAAAIAGCGDPPTRTSVVVVLESDLAIPGDVDGDSFLIAAGPDAPSPTSPGVTSVFYNFLLHAFPAAVELYPADTTQTFSITVQLQNGLTAPTGLPPTIALSRTVTDIRFTNQRRMMLVLQMLRACACDGTSCPALGNPDCDGIAQPTLQPYDLSLPAWKESQLLPVSQPQTGRH